MRRIKVTVRRPSTTERSDPDLRTPSGRPLPY
jgi:hypothetical protein